MPGQYSGPARVEMFSGSRNCVHIIATFNLLGTIFYKAGSGGQDDSTQFWHVMGCPVFDGSPTDFAYSW